ncbi:MAG: tetratricopeptide repeat protein [Chloroflexi bacterium]|nr:tetratricopeptide repeat protein [Chloroflexota bacterium]
MHKSLFVMVGIVVVGALLLTVPFATFAQDQSEGEQRVLICDQFVGSPDNLRTSYYMGEGAGLVASGQLTRALDSYSCIIEQIDSNFVPAYMGRGAVYTQRRDLEEALEDFTRAIQLSNRFAPAYNNRGIVYAALREYDEAVADFDQALQIDSSFTLALNNRAVISALRGDFDTAIRDLEQAISVTGIDGVIAVLRDPEREEDDPDPEYVFSDAQPYALLGIVYSAQALSNYRDYLLLTGSSGDARIQGAAGALESRFNFELRLDDTSWLLVASFDPAG